MEEAGRGEVEAMVDGRPSWVAVDLETTGLDPLTDRIIEIGAVRFSDDGVELGRYERLVNPERKVSAGSRAVHGISDAELASAPVMAEVLPVWLAWLELMPTAGLIAHNARFDASFLAQELSRCGLSAPAGCLIHDTLALARRERPGLATYRLDALARSLSLPVEGRGHRALADSLIVAALWRALGGGPRSRVAYGLELRQGEVGPPRGWERLSLSIEQGDRVRMAYAGGTRGTSPREMTPLRYVHSGGVAYVVGRCHEDGHEKRFRLDRIVWYERIVTATIGGSP